MFGNCECLTNSLCHCPSRYCVQTGVVVCAHAATSLLGYGGTAARCLALANELWTSPVRLTPVTRRFETAMAANCSEYDHRIQRSEPSFTVTRPGRPRGWS